MQLIYMNFPLSILAKSRSSKPANSSTCAVQRRITVFQYTLQNCTGIKEISSAERQEITCSLKYHKSHNHPALQLFYLN